MAPSTPFENSGTQATPAQEQLFLETVAIETDAVLTQAGTSIQGRPIWRVDLGADTDGTLMLVASQHGEEWIPREAALSWIRDLAYGQIAGAETYLQTHRIVVIPNGNPDGLVAGSHRNANNVDVNRDVFALSQPESRTIAAVMADADPDVHIDGHEGSTFSEDLTYFRASIIELYDGIGTLADDTLSDLASDLASAGATHAIYNNPGRNSLRESAALARHCVSLLLESKISGTTSDRHAHYLVALESIRQWHDANDTAAAAVREQARTHQATTTAQYILQTGTTGFPWPQTPLPPDLVGYRLTGGIVPPAFGFFGVGVGQGAIVELSQQARAVVPILLDPESDNVQAAAVRLTELPAPAPSASVREFADVVYGSHRMVAEARVLSTFQSGDDPDGELIDILGGGVTMDATADVFASLDLTTDGMDERRRSRFPRRAKDLLAPYGREVFVRRGVDLGGNGVLWSPLGYFRLDDDDQRKASDQPIRLAGQDRMAGIIGARLVIPRQYGRDRTFGDVVADLVGDVYPGAVVAFDDDSDSEPIRRTLLVEKDRYAALLDLTESLGKIVYWDGEGVLRIEDAPDPDDIVWHIKAGYHGVLADNDRHVSREGMANAIVARGEGGDTLEPVQAIVVDAGPDSPTRWFPPTDPDELWFGQVPDFYSSPLLTTEAQAIKAGTSLLRRRIGMPYSIGWTSVVNPALRPRQAVRVTQKDGTRERHLVETLTIPLTYDQGMTGTTMEQTNVRILQVQPRTLAGGR